MSPTSGDDTSLRRWFDRRDAWRDLPELADVPPARAKEVYTAGFARAWRRPAMRAAAVATFACWIGFVIAGLAIRDRLSLHGIVADLSWLVILPVYIIGYAYSFDRLTHSIIRRCVRAELGTHCAGCDYDLRATPDLPPPAVTRCPECGRTVPRNVHRRTIAPLAQPPVQRGP